MKLAFNFFFKDARYVAGEAAKPEAYSKFLSRLHWVIGGSIIGTVASVKLAQNTKDKEWKGRLMNVHKSLALIVCALVPVRIGARFASNIPKPIGNLYERMAASATHLGLYAFMIIMPVTGSSFFVFVSLFTSSWLFTFSYQGMTMNYFGGYGMPFFWTKFKGADEPNKELSKTAYQVHSWVCISMYLSFCFFDFAR